MSSEWRSINTAPYDGAKVRLKWGNGKEDIGRWIWFSDPEFVWKEHPEMQGQEGEWSTEYGNADMDEVTPQAWMPLPSPPETY